MSVVTIAVVGCEGVGKTSICSRLCANKFDNIHKSTTSRERFFTRTSYKGQDMVIALDDCEPYEILRTEVFAEKFWYEGETAYDEAEELFRKRRSNGMDKYNPIRKDMLRKRDAVLITYSCDDMDSFNDAIEIMENLFSRVGFNMQGWKKVPICAVLVGNKCDVIGEDCQVEEDVVDDIIKEKFTHHVTIDPETGELMKHLTHVRVSARMGYGMNEVIPLVVEKVMSRPTRISVTTPDKIDGIWGSLLRRYETARWVHQKSEAVGKKTGQWKASVNKTLKPVFKMDWLPKCPKLPKIPVPARFKIFPYKMWFCFCLAKDNPYADESDEEASLMGSSESDNDDY